ncbi:MAG: ABC transporter permease [Oscillospiraceae bacterium]|jgi:ABC-2 type transport system permease protein|nr:ABC transporter permease [Oscillospiraceae bacterium]
MRGFLATFAVGFKSLWKSPVSVFILIAFPILLILILGTALSTYISADIELEPAPMAVAAEEGGPLRAFLASPDISPFFELTYTDAAEAEALTKSGDVICAVVEGGDGSLDVLSQSQISFTAQIALSILDSYQRIGAAAAAAATEGGDIAAALGMDLSVTDMPLGKRAPSATDYYAVTMLVMILLYTGLNGVELFSKGMLSDTGRRARTAPISKAALVGGLLAASTVTSFLQGMVTFVFSGVVYGVYWGERIPLVLATLFAVVLLSQALCLFLLMLFRHPGAAGGAAQAFFWVSTFVSGGYTKVSFGPADAVFQYAPNAMAHTVIFGSIFGGNEGKMMFCLAALFGLGLLFYVLSFILGRRRFS